LIPGHSKYLSSKLGVTGMAAGIIYRAFGARGCRAKLITFKVPPDVGQPATGLILGVYLYELTIFQIQLKNGGRRDAYQPDDAGYGRRP
jgi:hypothetical protein